MGEPIRTERGARPLWVCPKCDRSFASLNATHACGPLTNLDDHFRGKSNEVRAIFDAIVGEVKRFGPVTVLPEKTRIALQVRISFAAFTPRRHWLNGHLVLARRIDSPRFTRIETFSPRNVLHAFRLSSAEEVDAELVGWLAEAYQVGLQRHT